MPRLSAVIRALPWLVAVSACQPAPMVETPARVTHDALGECWYTPGHWCSTKHPCDPPRALPADCPASLRKASADDSDDWRPPSRRSWVRVRERLVVTAATCGYYSDFYCPPPSHPTRTDCDPPEFRQVPCELGAGGARVAPFVAKRTSSLCVSYPALDCVRGECALPRGVPSACP